MKHKNITVSIVSCFILGGCSDTANKNKVNANDTMSTSQTVKSVNLPDTTTVGESEKDITKKVTVKLFQKKMATLSNESILTYNILKSKDKNCNDWKIPSKQDMLKIFESFYELSGSEWHDCYGDMSCGVEGKILYSSKEYNYRLDAGGWIMLYNKSEQIYFGCKSPDCKKYFPVDCFCNQDGLVDE